MCRAQLPHQAAKPVTLSSSQLCGRHLQAQLGERHAVGIREHRVEYLRGAQAKHLAWQNWDTLHTRGARHLNQGSKLCPLHGRRNITNM